MRGNAYPRGIVLIVYTGHARTSLRRNLAGVLSPCAFSWSDLQIPRSSLIIICLFGDAERFRCGNSCFNFIFLIDRFVIVY
jgi:hypothetical protein